MNRRLSAVGTTTFFAYTGAHRTHKKRAGDGPDTHLSVPVAERDGNDEPLEAVEDDVEVLVNGLPLAVRVLLRSVALQLILI